MEICLGNSKNSVPSTIAAYSGISLKIKTEKGSEKMEVPYKCFGTLENKTYLMNQEKSEFIKSKATKFAYFSEKNICLDVLILHFVEEIPLNYDAHNQICNAMGGRMLTLEEIIVNRLFILDSVSHLINNTIKERHEDLTETKLWIHGNKTTRYSVLGLGCPFIFSSGKKRLQADTLNWHYAKCNDQSLPNLCIAPRLRKFYLYSSLTLYGNEFVLDSEAATMNLYTGEGYYKNAKMYKKSDQWLLSVKFYTDVASLEKKLQPIGRNFWFFQGKKYLITLTPCNTTEFACSDGQCLPQSVRCNKKIECRDESDENECEFIKKHKSYEIAAIPPPPKSQDILQIEVDLSLIEMADISSNNGIIEFDIMFFYTWYDSRLEIWNPSPNRIIPCSQIWHPAVHMMQGQEKGFQVPFDHNFETCFIKKLDERNIQQSFSDPYMGKW